MIMVWLNRKRPHRKIKFSKQNKKTFSDKRRKYFETWKTITINSVEKHYCIHFKWATITPVDTRCTKKWAASPGGLKSRISEMGLKSLKINTAGVIWARLLKSWNKLPYLTLLLQWVPKLQYQWSRQWKKKTTELALTSSVKNYEELGWQLHYPASQWNQFTKNR